MQSQLSDMGHYRFQNDLKNFEKESIYKLNDRFTASLNFTKVSSDESNWTCHSSLIRKEKFQWHCQNVNSSDSKPIQEMIEDDEMFDGNFQKSKMSNN